MRAQQKPCSGCSQILARSAFRPRHNGAEVYHLCRACERVQKREHGKRYRQTAAYKVSAKTRSAAYRAAGKTRDRDNRNARRQRERHPERIAAYAILTEAVSTGKLVRPETCTVCGEIPSAMRDGRTGIQAHHANGYDKPLDVMWLCVACHRDEHRRARGGR